MVGEEVKAWQHRDGKEWVKVEGKVEGQYNKEGIDYYILSIRDADRTEHVRCQDVIKIF